MKIIIEIDERIPIGKQVADKMFKSSFIDDLTYWIREKCEWSEEEQDFLWNAKQYEGKGMLVDFDKLSWKKRRQKGDEKCQ